MANSADPDQLANWSGSTLFAKTGHIMFSKRRIKKYQLSKQCRPRSDATKYSNWSGSYLFAIHPATFVLYNALLGSKTDLSIKF